MICRLVGRKPKKDLLKKVKMVKAAPDKVHVYVDNSSTNGNTSGRAHLYTKV